MLARGPTGHAATAAGIAGPHRLRRTLTTSGDSAEMAEPGTVGPVPASGRGRAQEAYFTPHPYGSFSVTSG